MRKTTTILVLSCAVLLSALSCDQVSELAGVTATCTAIEDGKKLAIQWEKVENAEGYMVAVDGDTFLVSIDSVVINNPAKMISVWAYHADITGAAWSLDCRPIVTEGIEVWGRGSTENPNAFGFKEDDGTCQAYALSDEGNWPMVDLVVDDEVVSGLSFRSPDDYDPVYNNQENAARLYDGTRIKAPSKTLFEAAWSADPPDKTFYTATLPCAAGGVYFFWIDPSADMWDATEDHFAKAEVQSVEENKLVMKVAYQKIPGLLWLRTD